MYMKKVVSGINPHQEMFRLEEPLQISRKYDLDEAKEMARHRLKRIGEYALTEPTRGFRYAVQGLFVPHSQGENMAVVRYPERYAQQSADIVRRNVFDKYTDPNGDFTISLALIGLRAQFASVKQRRAMAMKYHDWKMNGTDKRLAMNAGLTFDGYISRPEVETNEKILGSISYYLADLRSYIAHPDTTVQYNKRHWIHDGSTRIHDRHRDWTKDFLKKQNDWELERWFAESWYNHASRALYWNKAIGASQQMREDISVQKYIIRNEEELRYLGYAD